MAKSKRVISIEANIKAGKDFAAWLEKVEDDFGDSMSQGFKNSIQNFKNWFAAIEKEFAGFGEDIDDQVFGAFIEKLKVIKKQMSGLYTQFNKLQGAEPDSVKAKRQAVESQTKAKESAAAALATARSRLNARDQGKLSDSELASLYREFIKNKGSITAGKTTYTSADQADQFVRNYKRLDVSKFAADSDAAKFADEAEKRLKEIQDSIPDLEKALSEVTTTLSKAIQELQRELQNIGTAHSDASMAGLNATQGVSDTYFDTASVFQEETKSKKTDNSSSGGTAADAIKEFNQETNKTPSLVQKAATQVFAYGTVLSLFRTLVNSAQRTITELDEALTGMAVVTNLTRQEAWGMVDSFQALAKETGSVTSEVAATTTKFLQQGKSLTQALTLSEAALKAAKIAGIDAGRSVDLLTNAMNGFQMSASQAMEVSDKFAALAAASATDYEELAVALSKVAAQANLAGMSMDFTLGMLAKGIEVTREAPETIGTALKTVISRMRELTDYGETLEEGTDVNRVETALKNVGVQLRDTSGQFRNLEDVLTELGGKWKELNVNQQANVAVALAGTRQQSRLIAMMQDFDRTLELVDISTNSYGATMAQHAEYMGSMQAAIDGLTTSYEGLITSLVNSDFVIGIVNFISTIVEGLDIILNNGWLLAGMIVSIGTIMAGNIAYHITEKKLQQDLLYAQRLRENSERKLWLEKNKNLKIEKVQAAQAKKNDKEQALRNEEEILAKKEINFLEERQNIINDQSLTEAEREAKIKALEDKYTVDTAENQERIATARQEFMEAENEYNIALAEQANYKAVELQYQQESLALTNKLTSSLGFVQSIYNTIIGLQKISLLFRKKEGKEIDKNNNKSFIGAMIEAAGNFFANYPVIGIILGAAVLAAVGIGIAAFAMAANSGKTATESNVEAVQKLQVELYNLGQTYSTVSALGDEFEELSNKINKTAEDTKRLQDIITDFNNAIGFDYLNANDDATTTKNKMAAYEAYLNKKMQEVLAESSALLDTGIRGAGSVGKYMETAEGEAVIRQNLGQRYKEFGASTEEVQNIILGSIKGDSSINEAKIRSMFTTDILDELNEAVKSGSLKAYKDALTNIEKMNDRTADLIKKSDTLFKYVSSINKETDKTIEAIDSAGFTPEQLSELSPILQSSGAKEALSKASTPADVISALYNNRFAGGPVTQGQIDAARDALANYESTDEYKKYVEWSEKLANKETLSAADQAKYEQYAQKYGALSRSLTELINTYDIQNMSVSEFWNKFANIETITGTQNSIDKLRSSLSQLGKAAIGELKGEELYELLGDYPELIDLMEDGVIAAHNMQEAQNIMFNNEKEKLEKNLSLIRGQYIADFGADKWKKMLSMSAKEIVETYGEKELEAWRNYTKYNTQYKAFIEQGILSDEAIEKLGESTGLLLAQSQFSAYSKQMELYSKDEAEYWNLSENAIAASYNAVKEAGKRQAKIMADLSKQLGGKEFEIINGQLFAKIGGQLTALSAIEDDATRQLFSNVNRNYAEWISEYEELDETRISSAQAISDQYLELKQHEVDKEKEIIESRKANYEDYFTAVDQLEEEQERAMSKDDIIKQLSALSTGIDGTSKSKIKELRQQLNDLQKEEAEARKEQAREELLSSMDDHIEKLDTTMEDLSEAMKSFVRAIVNGETDGLTDFTSIEKAFANIPIVSNLLNNGTISTDDVTSIVEGIVGSGYSTSTDSYDNDENVQVSIEIGTISINTNNLNNTQDFEAAGKALAREFSKAISERGLNVNVNK